MSNYDQTRFDQFIDEYDDSITLTTAATLAKELGVEFFPETYDKA